MHCDACLNECNRNELAKKENEMKLIKKILYVFIFMFCATNIFAQDDFDVKISETEVNEAIDAIIEARGLSFGSYNGTGSLNAWYANIGDAHIEILPNNVVNFVVDDMYFVAEINFTLFNFSIVNHIGGTFHGEIILDGNNTDGYKALLKINSLDDFNAKGDLSGLIGIYASLFNGGLILDYIPEIPISLTDITPNIILDVFDIGTPPISTDNGNIYINYK